MSSLVDWARSELDRLGSDEDGMQSVMNRGILEIIEKFSEQGHSGFSAAYAIGILRRLLAWKPITPLTGEDGEWNDVSDTLQQNKRCSSVFRENRDNLTAYDINGKVFSDDGGNSWFTKGGKGSAVPVTFPYTVPEKPEYIILESEED